ncbi:MAG: DUF6445 family protein [Erythrobacter sp.]
MAISFLVIDDFLESPDEMRNQAIGLEYHDQPGPYIGRNSKQHAQLPGLDQYVSSLVGENLKPIEPRQSHGKFRITLAEHDGVPAIHNDPSQWSGILYLTKPEHCQGGTEFFRHKETNLESSPINDQVAQDWGFSSQSEVIDSTLGKDAKNHDAWEKTMEIPMRYNRLLLLRPWLFHTSGPGFGTSPENGRLIYTMFFTMK